MDWIRGQRLSTINLINLSGWKKIGDKKDGDKTFLCDEGINAELLDLKVYYNCKLSKHEASSARNRLNPFELIENGIFQNRAGMKLANVDADLEFSLTSPRKPDSSPAVGPGETFYFVDVCGGPGGFSEYMLYRKGFDAKGFGITLRNTELDYHLDEIQAGPRECLEVYYGQHNTGNIYDPVNVKSFVELVLMTTHREGAHVMVADGGVDMDGAKQMNQEIACKHLYLSQLLIGLTALRTDGILVCKLFETNTVFSMGLLYLVHLCFEKMTVYKPRMSRPQNSERYLVCMHKRSQIDHIVKYLAECHQLLWEWSTNDEPTMQQLDILEIVPEEVLNKSPASEFTGKMFACNTRLCKNQVTALSELKKYAENTRLEAPGKEELRLKCYKEWKIPAPEDRRMRLKIGRRPYTEMTQETFERLCSGLDSDFRLFQDVKVCHGELNRIFKSPYDWRVAVIQGTCDEIKSSRGYYLSQGGSEFFRYNESSEEWVDLSYSVELPKDTILYGECVTELCGVGSTQRRNKVFHIIDLLYVNGMNVGHFHYMTRHEIIRKLVRSVNKPSRKDLIEVKAKQLIRMENIADIFRTCQKVDLSGEKRRLWTCHTNLADPRSPTMVAGGLLFLKMTKDPWIMSLSRSSQKKYWFHTEAATATYELPQSSVTSFIDTMKQRAMWTWMDSTSLEVVQKSESLGLEKIPNGHDKHDHDLSADGFLKFVNEFNHTLGEHSVSPTKRSV